MPGHLQNFLAASTLHVAESLSKAFLSLPKERRAWPAGGSARTAADQLAECVVINNGVAEGILDPATAANYDMAGFKAAIQELAGDLAALPGALAESARKLALAIETVPDESLDTEIELPWGKWKMSQLMGHPYWNMSYHEGQVNFISHLIES